MVDALRDPDRRVRTMALTVLWSFNKYLARKVDWQPAKISLKHLLNGTYLNASYNVFDMLAKTKISSDLAPFLIKDRGDLIFYFLSSENHYIRDIAHTCLVQLSKKDYGYNINNWLEWIAGLKSQKH